MRYLTVQREGRTLGFVWAAVGEQAAYFAPRIAAGDEAFEVGHEWLLRLREARARGLTALSALDWLAALPRRAEVGEVLSGPPAESPSLDALEDFAGRY